MVFVDTNIFIRYLTGNDPVKYERCKKLFEKAVDGKISLLTPEIVIAEIIWTLKAFCRESCKTTGRNKREERLAGVF